MKNIKYLMCTLIGFILAIGISNVYILNASLVTYDKKNTTLVSENISGALNELGVMVNDKLQYGTATSDDILSGKTALVNGKEIIGTANINNGLYIDKFGIRYPGSDVGANYSQVIIDTSKYNSLTIDSISILNTSSGYCRVTSEDTVLASYYDSISNIKIDISSYNKIYLLCYANRFASDSISEFNGVLFS